MGACSRPRSLAPAPTRCSPERLKRSPYGGLRPRLLGQVRQPLPVAQGLQTAHAAQSDVEVERVLALLVFVGGQGVFPTLQLFVPRLFQVQLVVLLRKLRRRRAHSRERWGHVHRRQRRATACNVSEVASNGLRDCGGARASRSAHEKKRAPCAAPLECPRQRLAAAAGY